MKTNSSVQSAPPSAPCGCPRCHCRALGGICGCPSYNALMALVLWDFPRWRRAVRRTATAQSGR